MIPDAFWQVRDPWNILVCTVPLCVLWHLIAGIEGSRLWFDFGVYALLEQSPASSTLPITNGFCPRSHIKGGSQDADGLLGPDGSLPQCAAVGTA